MGAANPVLESVDEGIKKRAIDPHKWAFQE